MTDGNHPITPPQSLISERRRNLKVGYDEDAIFFARWGADQEFEGCYEAIKEAWDSADSLTLDEFLGEFRSIRRPTPPSLKEQAQRILVENGTTLDGRMELDPDDIAIIRRALEALPD